jgi:hypothetical protein
VCVRGFNETLFNRVTKSLHLPPASAVQQPDDFEEHVVRESVGAGKAVHEGVDGPLERVGEGGVPGGGPRGSDVPHLGLICRSDCHLLIVVFGVGNLVHLFDVGGGGVFIFNFPNKPLCWEGWFSRKGEPQCFPRHLLSRIPNKPDLFAYLKGLTSTSTTMLFALSSSST